MAEGKVTVVPIAPPVIAAWLGLEDDELRSRLTSVRLLLSGAAPLAEETVRTFERAHRHRRRAGLRPHRGGTDRHLDHRDTRAQAGLVRTCRAGRRARVVDDGGRDVDADDPGEILVRGANVFSGYWPDADGGPGPDGWLATGDIGFLDPTATSSWSTG